MATASLIPATAVIAAPQPEHTQADPGHLTRQLGLVGFDLLRAQLKAVDAKAAPHDAEHANDTLEMLEDTFHHLVDVAYPHTRLDDDEDAATGASAAAPA